MDKVQIENEVQAFIPKLDIRKAFIEIQGREKRYTLEVLFQGRYFTVQRIEHTSTPEDWVIRILAEDMKHAVRSEYGL